MTWVMKIPNSPPTLAEVIGEVATGSEEGGGAFAFATSSGIKMLFGEPKFRDFVTNHPFDLLIGLDAITDTAALQQLRIMAETYPKLSVSFFVHSAAGALFHPKTVWVKSIKGGAVLTGSGNLTSGGLKQNWEAYAVTKLSATEAEDVKNHWVDWKKQHNANLVGSNDESARKKAKDNERARRRIRAAIKKGELPDAVEEEVIAEAVAETALSAVLIAEVPKSGNRWKQVNFDLHSFQSYFGVKLGVPRDVVLYHVNDDGSFDPAENRHAVAVKSQNYRFEIGAIGDLAYPQSGHPILMFEQISDNDFKYVLIMPHDNAHGMIQSYLDTNYAPAKGKRRIITNLIEVSKVWPDCPLL